MEQVSVWCPRSVSRIAGNLFNSLNNSYTDLRIFRAGIPDLAGTTDWEAFEKQSLKDHFVTGV